MGKAERMGRRGSPERWRGLAEWETGLPGRLEPVTDRRHSREAKAGVEGE